MELFEILFIALFILFPILEQVLKRRKTGGQPGPGDQGRDSTTERMGTGSADAGRGSPRRESETASEMVPDDLWAVLTGEQRPRGGTELEDEEPATPEPAGAEPTPEEAPARWEEAWTPRPEPRWRMDDFEERPAPASLEQYGPEAYSLEDFERDPVSLETPVASSDARHRRFHRIIDRPRPRRPVPRSRIGRALRTSESLRQAFVLSEVLGTPKGLE